jgi:hypothetical protein
MEDIYHRFRTTSAIDPIAMTTANADGIGVDLQGYRGALISVSLGASGNTLGASNLVTLQFYESTDNSTWTAIADTDLLGGNNTAVIDANAEANTVVQRGYVGFKRYVTVTANPTGEVALPISAVVVRGFPLTSIA